MIVEFFAHQTPSLFGEGDADEAAQLCYFMNRHRALSVWDFQQVERANGPVMNIADEIRRHHAARGAA